MSITVHHVRDWPANPTERDVYCGRKCNVNGVELPDSPLRNPDSEARHLACHAVDLYYTHLDRTLCGFLTELGTIAWSHEIREEFDRLLCLSRTGDLRLYCWCAPKTCHCDVIKAELEARI